MRIVLRRTGGFGGMTRVWAVDTRRLSRPEASEVQRLADAARVIGRPPAAPQVRDAFHWEVELDGELHTVPDGSAAWTDLIDRVCALDREAE